MKGLRIILCLLLVVAVHTGLRGQTLAKIQNTNITLDNDRIIITYDLAETKSWEKFEIWLRITGADGVLIQGRSFSGDIGKNIRGGEGLIIYWNYAEDQITLSDELSIQVMAERLNKKELSYATVLGMSIVFPGWGLANMESKKLYGLMGLAGYGSLAASLAYTFNSKNTYEEYDNSNLTVERDNLYDEYISRKNMAEIFAWSAAAIWVADIVWMTVKFGKSKEDPGASASRRISLGCTYSMASETPVISMSIRF